MSVVRQVSIVKNYLHVLIKKVLKEMEAYKNYVKTDQHVFMYANLLQ